jgi:hypothetical protein
MKTDDEGGLRPRSPSAEDTAAELKRRFGRAAISFEMEGAIEDAIHNAEVAAGARGRLEGLEEAAHLCEQHANELPPHSEARRITASNLAHGIRALSSEQPGAAAPSGTSGDAGKLERAPTRVTTDSEEC